MKCNETFWNLLIIGKREWQFCSVLLTSIISRFCFSTFQNFTAEFQTLSNLINFRLIIQNRQRNTKKSTSQLPNGACPSLLCHTHGKKSFKRLTPKWKKVFETENERKNLFRKNFFYPPCVGAQSYKTF